MTEEPLTMDPVWIAIWVIWALLFAVSFAVIEYMSRHRDRRPYLTEVIKAALPKWAIATIIGGAAFWGFDHFT